MSTTNNTPCGCRCNSANDTRGAMQPGLRAAKAIATVMYSPLSAADVRSHAQELRGFLACLDGEIVRAALVGKCEPDFLDRERQEVDSGCKFPNVVVPVFPERECFRQGGLTVTESGSDHFLAAGNHCSSPVVAESEADTSDAPAMTVQEGGGDMNAAPGVEGVSPASSAPRFVVLGALVYDRDANKAVSCTNSAAARSVADELNTGYGQIAGIYWEDAK